MMRDMVSYELIGFTVTFIPKESVVHQHEVDPDDGAWYVFPDGYVGMDSYVTPLTDEEVKAGKHRVYGKFDRLYRTDDDLYRINYDFVGNSRSRAVGGIHAETDNMGREVFDNWQQQIVAIARVHLEGYVKPKNSAESHYPVSFVTVWEYAAGVWSLPSEPDDYWSGWKLIGEVKQEMIDDIARKLNEAKKESV